MRIQDHLHRIARRLGLARRVPGIAPFAIGRDEAARRCPPESSRLAGLFLNHPGRTVHKWAHYIPAYEAHFARFAGTPARMLEIGVFRGGSLQLWRSYLGETATIFGIDVDPACARVADPQNPVRIGSQDDPAFLRAVVAEMGGLDIVLDDGSHHAPHQRASFDVLFPLLAEGGIYAIEDLHTAYWPGRFEGGYRRPGTAIELVKRLIDDMHAPYHGRAELPANASRWIPAIHVYDSVVFIEKARRAPPGHVMIGGS